jgi:hypothetical protein
MRGLVLRRRERGCRKHVSTIIIPPLVSSQDGLTWPIPPAAPATTTRRVGCQQKKVSLELPRVDANAGLRGKLISIAAHTSLDHDGGL